MAAPFDPVLVAEEFVYDQLSGDAAVTAAFGTRIYPGFSPAEVESIHATFDYAGPDEGVAAVPFGQGIAVIGMYWDITGWEPSPDRQRLRAGMKAVMAVLTGPSIAGRRFGFADADGTAWWVECRYRGPIVVPADVGPAGSWQRVSARYELALSPQA